MSSDWQGAQAGETATTSWWKRYTTAFVVAQERETRLCGGWHPDGPDDGVIGAEAEMPGSASK
jgi:hypothetical protein